MWNRLGCYFEAHMRCWRRLKRYLSTEIMIEYRACLYFCCILFFLLLLSWVARRFFRQGSSFGRDDFAYVCDVLSATLCVSKF